MMSTPPPSAPHAAFAALVAVLFTCGSLAAQTGPFADGELLVEGYTSGDLSLYRVDPLTGAGAELVADLYQGYQGAGWMTYDAYRGGLIAYTSTFPLGVFSPRLVMIRDDGDLSDLGLQGAQVSGLTSVGDGRIYFRKQGVLHLLDANHQIWPVLDNGNPISLPVEHLVYDAPSSSLLGVSINQATTPCSAFLHTTAHKLPLAADGKSLAGPIVCTSLDVGMPSASPVGLDRMPDGDYLVTLADGHISDDQMLRLDPVTMTLSLFAEPDYSDIDGGVWSQALGKAVILEDGGNTLRIYQEGDDGPGTLLATPVLTFDTATGTSTHNKLLDVNISGPVCSGDANSFGSGSLGSYQTPARLAAAGCPRIGQTLPLVVTAGYPGAAFIGLSLASASYPLFGGTGYLLPPLLATLPLTLPGTPGLPVWGSVAIPVPDQPVLVGVHIYAQGGAIDPLATANVALTNALELVIGG
jgi:hypothetical protein